MGADFLFSLCKMPPDWMTKEEAIDRIVYGCLNLTPEAADETLAEITGGFDDEIEEARIELGGIAKEALEWLYQDPRDLSTINLWSEDGTQNWHWISGGMSHGDSPTDSFDYLNKLEWIFMATGEVWNVEQRQEDKDADQESPQGVVRSPSL